MSNLSVAQDTMVDLLLRVAWAEKKAEYVLADEALARGLAVLMVTNSPDNRSALRTALLKGLE